MGILKIFPLCFAICLVSCSAKRQKVSVLADATQASDAERISAAIGSCLENEGFTADISLFVLKGDSASEKSTIESFRSESGMRFVYGEGALRSFIPYSSKASPAVFLGIKKNCDIRTGNIPGLSGCFSENRDAENIRYASSLIKNAEIDIIYNPEDTLGQRDSIIGLSKLPLDQSSATFLRGEDRFSMSSYLSHRNPVRESSYISFLPLREMDGNDLKRMKTSYREQHVLVSLSGDEHLCPFYDGPAVTSNPSDLVYGNVIGGIVTKDETLAEDALKLAKDAALGKFRTVVSESSKVIFSSRMEKYGYVNLSGQDDGKKEENSVPTSLIASLDIVLAILLLAALAAILLVRRYHKRTMNDRYKSLDDLFSSFLDSGAIVWIHSNGIWKRRSRKTGSFYTNDEISLEDEEMADLVMDTDKAKFERICQASDGETGIENISLYLNREDKEPQLCHFEYICSVAENKDRTIYAVSFNMDIVDSRKKQIIDDVDVLEDNDLCDSFFVSMSNEIRTPLSTIVATSNLLSSEEASYLSLEEKGEMNILLKQEVSVLLHYMREILQTAYVNAGMKKFNKEYIDIDELASDIYDNDKNFPSTSIRYRITHNPSKVLVYVDKQMVRDIFKDIIVFSSINTMDGVIEIGSYADTENGLAVLYVKDTSVYQEAENIENIFTIGGIDYNKYKTGLAVAKSLAEGLGCKLKAECLDGGMKFSLCIPCQVSNL